MKNFQSQPLLFTKVSEVGFQPKKLPLKLELFISF